MTGYTNRRAQTERLPHRVKMRSVWKDAAGDEWIVTGTFYLEHSSDRPYVRCVRVRRRGDSWCLYLSEARFLFRFVEVRRIA